MNGTARHNIETEIIQLSQGFAPYPRYSNRSGIGGLSPKGLAQRGTSLSDLTFPILPRTDLFGDADAPRWDAIANLTKSALDSLTHKERPLCGTHAAMRFFGQLQRLHTELPDALVKEFDDDHGQTGVALFKPVHETSHIWAIPMEPIFFLRKKCPKLFVALLSFVHGLPFDNVFNRSGYILECLLEWSFEMAAEESETEGCCPDGRCILCFIGRYAALYENHCQGNWQGILKTYRPRKPIYQKLKKLLLDAPNINFNGFANLCFLGDNTDLQVDDLVVFIDRADSQMENGYLSFINEIAQHGYSHTIYDVAIAKADGTEGFGFADSVKVGEVLDFLEHFNELIQQL